MTETVEWPFENHTMHTLTEREVITKRGNNCRIDPHSTETWTLMVNGCVKRDNILDYLPARCETHLGQKFETSHPFLDEREEVFGVTHRNIDRFIDCLPEHATVEKRFDDMRFQLAPLRIKGVLEVQL